MYKCVWLHATVSMQEWPIVIHIHVVSMQEWLIGVYIVSMQEWLTMVHMQEWRSSLCSWHAGMAHRCVYR